MSADAGRPSDYLTTIASFVPDMILREANAGAGQPTQASLQEIEAAVLFIDVAGFTALTETLAKRGDAGAEDLTRLLNLYLGQLIDAVVDRGGDVVKFAGDALIALWPADEERSLTVQLDRALFCALDIRARLSDFEVAEGFRMRVKLAVAAGQVWAERLGGVFDRWELLIAGDALGQISVAADYAMPGDVIVAAPTALRLGARVYGDEAPAGALRAHGLDRDPATSEHVFQMAQGLTPQPHAAAVIRNFIPAAVRLRLEVESVAWLGELRRISVLFINLPDLGVETPFAQAQEAMRMIQVELYRFEGSINKMSVDDKGASLIAVYGLPPLAHADDPERAVRAAGAVQAALTRSGLSSWIGVTTGTAFCGVIGNDRRREYTIMGDVVNLAARLMQASAGGLVGQPVAGGVLCCGATFAASSARLSFETLEPIRVKGKAEPIAVYRPLLRKRPPAAATSAQSQMRVIGRETERAAIARLLMQMADTGQPQRMALIGDGGIGKSRLLHEAVRLAGEHQMVTLIGGGDPIETATPYFAWRQIFETLLVSDPGISDQFDDETQRGQVLSSLPPDPLILRDAPLLDAVLPLGFEDNDFTRLLSGKARSERTRQLLTRILSGVIGASGRMLLVIKDAHWLDSASLTLLGDVANLTAPIGLILSCQLAAAKAAADRASTHEPNADWSNFIRAQKFELVELGPLSAEALKAICCRRLGVPELPATLANFVIDRCEGNPLFAEELVLSLRGNGIISVIGNTVTIAAGSEDPEQWRLPETMEGVISARIDQLPAAEQMTMKVASVIGRTFAKEALSNIHPTERGEDELVRQCSVLAKLEMTPLVKAGSLLTKPHNSSVSWKFKSNLLKDVTYNRMLYAQRRELHRKMAEWIEAVVDPEQTVVAPLLAFHWRHAAEDRELDPEAALKSAAYYGRAANHALRLHALKEAISDWQEALTLLARLPSSSARDALELQLLLELGPALVAADSFSGSDVEAVFDRARVLGEAAGKHGLLFRALRGQWQVRIGRGDYRGAGALGDELLVLADRADDPTLRLEAWRCKGTTALWTANYLTAATALERSVGLYDPAVHPTLSQIYGQDPKVAALGLLAWAKAHLGEREGALACAQQAQTWARQLEHPFTLAYAHGAMMWTGYFLDDRAGAQAAAGLCRDMALERGYPYFVAAGRVAYGWATGHLSELNDAVQAWRTMGGGIGMGLFLLVQADAELDADRVHEAKQKLEDPNLIKQIENDDWLKPLHLRLLGRAQIMLGDQVTGQDSLRRARAIAMSQGAVLHAIRIDEGMALLNQP